MRTLIKSIVFWIRLLFQPTLGLPFAKLCLLGRRFYGDTHHEDFENAFRAHKRQALGVRVALVLLPLGIAAAIFAAVSMAREEPTIALRDTPNMLGLAMLGAGPVLIFFGGAAIFGGQQEAWKLRGSARGWSLFMKRAIALRELAPETFKALGGSWDEVPGLLRIAKTEFAAKEVAIVSNLSSSVAFCDADIVAQRVLLERLKETGQAFRLASFGTIEVRIKPAETLDVPKLSETSAQ